MAMNGVYNYNNYVMGGKTYNSPNENGINMSLVAKGRLYKSFESKGEKYYGVSYTSEMQKEGKIGIPDSSAPGKYKIVDVDSDEGQARLKELEQEKTDALAELKKFEDFRHPPATGSQTESTATAETKTSTPAETAAKTDSGVINDLKQKHEHNRRSWDSANSGTYTKHGTMRPKTDELREVKSGIKNNVSAFKKMVYAHAKAQAQHAGKGGKDSTLKDMLKGVVNSTPAEAQSAISEDGEWGVKKTAERLLNFAVAISGGDPSKISELRDAVRKGFAAAEKVWGGGLPGICHDTLQAVMDGFDKWEKTGSAQSISA